MTNKQVIKMKLKKEILSIKLNRVSIELKKVDLQNVQNYILKYSSNMSINEVQELFDRIGIIKDQIRDLQEDNAYHEGNIRGYKLDIKGR